MTPISRLRDQSTSAGQAAFTTAWVIALGAVVGTLFVHRPPAVDEPDHPTPVSSTATTDTSLTAAAG
jgi:hypothetical protein